MWNDVETTQDLLNFKVVADTAAQMIKDGNGQPVSIGVSGSWGVGKSSLVQMIGESLKSLDGGKNYIFINFNAWLYQGYDDARMALLQKVADKIMEESEARKTCVDKAKEFIKRINWLRTAKFMAPVATGIITGGAVAGPVGSFIGAVSGLLGQSGMPSQEDLSKIKESYNKALDEFCIEKGKLIREALLGSVQYANYDKRRFKEAVTKLKRQTLRPTALSNEQKQSLRKQKELQAKPSVSRLIFTPPDLEYLHSQTSELLKRSVVSQVIDTLVNDVSVAAWVQQGLTLHKGEHETDTCRFCGNGFSTERRAKLEGHFNDAFAAFQQEIDAAIRAIDGQQKSLASVVFPDESRLYDHLASNLQNAVNIANQAIQSVDQTLEFLKESLESKKSSPFDVLTLENRDKQEDSGGKNLQAAIDVVNGIIGKHEETTSHLEDEVKRACELLEQDYVLESLPKFDELSSSSTEATTALTTANEKPDELRKKIEEIERQIVEHRRPAEELNRELQAYLGRDELQFAIKETGYALTRGGKPAKHLSEGERTAIAFLYFLKSLEDKAFDLSKGIVVIDDPVSSLDANALFSAFGYMKERTKSCHQLFIFTHNFAFFRQVKNWFHHLKGQNSPHIERRPGRFYALLSTTDGCERSATLTPIDPLLEQFESEYHFLFRQVYDVANSTVCTNGLAQFYGLPNIARRLIETFLAYRFPDCSGDLIKRLERVDYDAEKKTRILRLLNTYSHFGGISDPEHDPSVLAETGEVMKAILEMMESVDGHHYEGMVKLICPVQEEV